jgi:hypothetical protein
MTGVAGAGTPRGFGELSIVNPYCIDKSNHAELSEAIASMYRWYRDTVKCYVYLSEVLAHDDDNAQTQQT